MVKIAVDAMGGDHAPLEIIKGSVQASQELPDVGIILAGDPLQINPLLKKFKAPASITVAPATQVIGMNEHPVSAVREKKDSSINVALDQVKQHKAQAVVSAGNTGALMAAALFKLGRIPGIERPAIATIFPTIKGRVVLLDMGANVDNKPQHLEQFGIMGSQYAQHILHVQNPRVGLINIGEEKEKGNELTRAAWELLSKAPVNFVGNVESKDVLSGSVDVAVCDGFVGNLMLKLAEGIAGTIMDIFKEEFSSSLSAKVAALFLLPSFKRIKKKIDYSEIGGAQLLGVDGVCVKSHGRAKASAIKNAIRVANECVKENIVEYIKKAELR